MNTVPDLINAKRMLDGQKPLSNAKGEGWDVFHCAGSVEGEWQIQSVDDRDGEYEPYFNSDIEAIEYVIDMAKKGDTECAAALKQVIPYDRMVRVRLDLPPLPGSS